jgi:hypothetical protein
MSCFEIFISNAHTSTVQQSEEEARERRRYTTTMDIPLDEDYFGEENEELHHMIEPLVFS